MVDTKGPKCQSLNVWKDLSYNYEGKILYKIGPLFLIKVVYSLCVFWHFEFVKAFFQPKLNFKLKSQLSLWQWHSRYKVAAILTILSFARHFCIMSPKFPKFKKDQNAAEKFQIGIDKSTKLKKFNESGHNYHLTLLTILNFS